MSRFKGLRQIKNLSGCNSAYSGSSKFHFADCCKIDTLRLSNLKGIPIQLLTPDYCRAVLTADEKWRLNLLIQNVRRWSIFGIDFESLREAWDRPLFQPILREELAPETHRDFVNEWPWMGSNNDRPEVRRATVELWESLDLNSGLSRLEFFLEFGKRSTDISRLASAVRALQRGEPTEGQLCETRLNTWCRSVVLRYLENKQALESQQVATIG